MKIDKNTCVVVQGMTGKEGRRASKEMIDSGVNVSCGVTPGKGGQEVEDKKIFDSIREAKEYEPKINTSVLYVPPLMAYDAAMEAMQNGINTVIIITENVPVKDATKLLEYARKNGHRLIGPSSVGVLNTRAGKIGSIGFVDGSAFSKGNIGIISKSGGMCKETATILTQAGLGQSLAIGIGGDVIIGTTFTDMLEIMEKDDDTDAVVIFGEIGGTYEEAVADMVKEKKFTKPIVAFISGRFAETMSRSLALGHAGAIIEGGKGTAKEKKKALRDAGILVADFHHEIPELVKKALG